MKQLCLQASKCAAPLKKAYSFEMIKKTWANDPAFTCSKSTIETPEQGVKYIQS